jgi:septal ring factor EnvC (AmiA/AmiB activator)
MSAEMNTPRTDAQAGWAIANQYGQSTGSELLGDPDGVFVHAVFARTLERELAALTTERDELRADCENETKWAAHYLAESIAVKAERDQLQAALLLAQENCDDVYDELRGDNDELRGDVVRLTARAARAEADLAAERTRLDWVFHNCKVEADDYTTGNRDVYAIHDREDLGAAMKEGAK